MLFNWFYHHYHVPRHPSHSISSACQRRIKGVRGKARPCFRSKLRASNITDIPQYSNHSRCNRHLPHACQWQSPRSKRKLTYCKHHVAIRILSRGRLFISSQVENVFPPIGFCRDPQRQQSMIRPMKRHLIRLDGLTCRSKAEGEYVSNFVLQRSTGFCAIIPDGWGIVNWKALGKPSSALCRMNCSHLYPWPDAPSHARRSRPLCSSDLCVAFLLHMIDSEVSWRERSPLWRRRHPCWRASGRVVWHLAHVMSRLSCS